MTKKTEFGQGITLTDWEGPEYLDGAQMQFMVTLEGGNLGACLAYFGTKEDAELFAKAKAAQSPIEEPALAGDEVDATGALASLTHRLIAQIASVDRDTEYQIHEAGAIAFEPDSTRPDVSTCQCPLCDGRRWEAKRNSTNV